jgi:hypothetical protein
METAMQLPTPHPAIDYPDYWRERAGEVRRLAVGQPSQSKLRLKEMAAAYDELARRAQERLRRATVAPHQRRRRPRHRDVVVETAKALVP